MQHPYTRPRRLRQNAAIRDLVQEHTLRVQDLIQPLFVIEGEKLEVPIASLKGNFQYSVDRLGKKAAFLYDLGIRAVALFPAMDSQHKSNDACAAVDESGLIPRAIQAIKARAPNLLVITDVSLDPYTPHGHDGLMDENTGEVLNDATLDILVQQGLCHLHAGADILAPSDMMDGRVGALRRACEQQNWPNATILAYTAKYASCLYGPFREAVNSKDALSNKDKKTYQMSPCNRKEASKEALLDAREGADILMVKPAMFYLDVISDLAAATPLPVFAYQVSGEYAMLCGLENPKRGFIESLISIKRAGATAILSYYSEAFAKAQNT